MKNIKEQVLDLNLKDMVLCLLRDTPFKKKSLRVSFSYVGEQSLVSQNGDFSVPFKGAIKNNGEKKEGLIDILKYKFEINEEGIPTLIILSDKLVEDQSGYIKPNETILQNSEVENEMYKYMFDSINQTIKEEQSENISCNLKENKLLSSNLKKMEYCESLCMKENFQVGKNISALGKRSNLSFSINEILYVVNKRMVNWSELEFSKEILDYI